MEVERYQAGRELKFLEGELKLSLLLGLFAGGNLMAKLTGMIAVKGLRDRLGKRGVAQIVSKHCRPGDGLQHGPMPADGRNERDCQQELAGAFEHVTTLQQAIASVKRLFCGRVVC